MTTAPAIQIAPHPTNLAAPLLELPQLCQIVGDLQRGESVAVGGVWGASRALLVAALQQAAQATLCPVVVVCPRAEETEKLSDALQLFSQTPAADFPPLERDEQEQLLQEPAFGERLALLKRLADDDYPPIITSSIQALLQWLPSKTWLKSATRVLARQDEVELSSLAAWLAESGYHATPAVSLPGEFSHRGGILDVFAPDWQHPVRIEFFGDEVESIRSFDIQSQRSVKEIKSVSVTALGGYQGEKALLTDVLPTESWVILFEPAEVEQEGQQYLSCIEDDQAVSRLPQTLAAIYQFTTISAAGISTGSFDTTCHLPIESVERFSGQVDRVRDELDAIAQHEQVLLVCETAAEQQRLQELFAESKLAQQGRLDFIIGRLHDGFRIVPLGIALVSGAEMFGRHDITRVAQRHTGRAIESFLELRTGDLVVHVAHGIARYRGLTVLEQDGRVQEHLELEFDGGTKLFVPSSKIELVQKYVGGRQARPKLAKIGGKAWIRQKEAAQAAATDLAADLIDLQAARQSRPGITFGEDTLWQREFDASFPFTETPDQISAIDAIKTDMRRPRPMDRLLCGDVGFGKTEVAMRAAFKAAEAGYQVAVLVPTTILAEQHYRTFRERMAEFPLEIAKLSRFCTKREQRETINALQEGTIDIVIGTHRLAQKDVSFANLGLIVIDEEQRFGVAVKERLKAARATVDVLTMTATPIPRTLHFSLLGIRDIANLESPPEDRLAVETRVCRFDEDQIRHAVLRELSRGGQVFFVHNRVHDIELVAARLGRIVPEATIVIGHGQMPEGELARVMVQFLDRQADILLATTIVESGLDIPNANTIFIDDADRYGLADLHQLRGRVGRYKHRAYCYLLVDPDRHLSPESARRLRAIEEFSQMGAGFALSMRDLELRGAGNILGTQQSGHIATVGYELYCSLLENAVRNLKNLPPQTTVDVAIDLPGAAYLPPSFVPDPRLKIDLYRRWSRLATLDDVQDFASELDDRFGKLPAVVERMMQLAQMRVLAYQWGISSIDVEDRFVVMRYGDAGKIRRLAGHTKRPLRIVDGHSAYLPIGRDAINNGACVEIVKSVLQTPQVDL